MTDWFLALSCPLQALIATLFTWSVTLLGAAVVLFFRRTNKSLMDGMLGFAAGIMTAASFWSLLSPAIERAGELGINPWLTAAAGFAAGILLLYLGDKLFDSIRRRRERKKNCCAAGGGFRRCAMLIFAITLHNIPEGLAVGVAFGSLASGQDGGAVAAACMLALGIGLQNFPEGAAVSLPLRREGMSRGKAFFYGQLSGFAEPVAGVLGALLVIWARECLPFLLSFAAGAMMYVVVGELIPESQKNKKREVMTLLTLAGFCLMMVLDVALG